MGLREKTIEGGAAMRAPSQPSAVARVTGAVARALGDVPRLVLAVSGGRDSMVMLDAVARTHRDRVCLVATFDHGTGPAASDAAALVEARSAALGLPVVRGRAERAVHGEAAWREVRWRFLREVAGAHDALVATAHTRDDQVETVLMRAFRGAGARGLAGLYATPGVARPLLDVSRGEVARYAAEQSLQWVEDPSNASRRFLRNRVRLDLLPTLERAHPGLGDELLAIARRAAALRTDVDQFIDHALEVRTTHGGRGIAVARAELLGYDAQGLRLLWPALAARAGIVLDRRGTERLRQFTIKGAPGGRIQLSGGYEAVMNRGVIAVRRSGEGGALAPRGAADVAPRTLDRGEGGTLSWGGWHFRSMGPVNCELEGAEREGTAGGLWSAALPGDQTLQVRPWRPGDRMTPHGAAAPRRVKGLLRDAGIDAAARRGWLVVLAGDEIVWIPGVRRSSAATVRSGRPLVLYHCERDDR
jgi:tRNA(Ile)-lysidine synthase